MYQVVTARPFGTHGLHVEVETLEEAQEIADELATEPKLSVQILNDWEPLSAGQ